MPKPKVASVRRQCANCREPIWVAKKWPTTSAENLQPLHEAQRIKKSEWNALALRGV
jgi:hypothetical protein